MPAGSNNFCIGDHLFVEDGKCKFNSPFNEHADQDTFGRSVSKGAVDLSTVPGFALRRQSPIQQQEISLLHL